MSDIERITKELRWAAAFKVEQQVKRLLMEGFMIEEIAIEYNSFTGVTTVTAEEAFGG